MCVCEKEIFYPFSAHGDGDPSSTKLISGKAACVYGPEPPMDDGTEATVIQR